jgi:hypothetical protein
VFDNFTDSPISARTLIKDVCIYDEGVQNKIGKVGKTSWDSFSYAIQMGHNVWSHISAVQEANRQYDTNIMPAMMDSELADKKTPRKYDGVTKFRDMVDIIFKINNRQEALEKVEYFSKYFTDIRGTRGATGDATVSANPMADDLGIPPAPDLSDLKPIKKTEPTENTFGSLFEEV